MTSDISCGINGKHEEENISKSIEVPTKPVVGKPKKNITCNVEASSEKLNLTKCKANVTEIESFGQKSNGSKRLPGESIGQLTDVSIDVMSLCFYDRVIKYQMFKYMRMLCTTHLFIYLTKQIILSYINYH